MHPRQHPVAIFALLSTALAALACGGLTSTASDQSPATSATSAVSAAPTPMGGGGRIAFASGRDGDYEIYSLEPGSIQATRLTNSDPKGKYFPKWSPDGTVLLYWTYSAQPYVSDEYWLDADGKTDVFANGVQPYVSFSPDGQTVVLCTAMEDGDIEVGTVPAAGGDFTRLTNSPGKDFMPAWSPDGKTIAFASERDGPTHIYLMDADGGNPRRLTDNDLLEAAPAWSPDGSQIAFFGGSDSEITNVYVVNADGSGTTNITNQASGYNEDPSWSPDGQMIVFWSDRSGDHEVYAIRADGSGLVNLTNSPGPDENPDWSR
jgi:tol-pal system beta propeller repeat protein TolB